MAGVAADLGTMNSEAHILIGERQGWGDSQPFGISAADMALTTGSTWSLHHPVQSQSVCRLIEISNRSKACC